MSDYRSVKDDLRNNPFYQRVENDLKEWCKAHNVLYVVRGAAGREELDVLYKADLDKQKQEREELEIEERRIEAAKRKAERFAEWLKTVPDRYKDAKIEDLKMGREAQRILEGASALVLGNNGAGKNHFIWALAKEWKKNDEEVRIEKAQELLFRIKTQEDPYAYIRKNYGKNIKHLIIDEIDKIFESKADFVYLFYLIDFRYEWCLQSMILGNGDKEGFISVLGQSIYSRLTGEGGVYLQHKGEDRRKKAS